MRILVVDDDRISSKMVSWQLNKRGHDVLQVYSGAECLEVVKKEDIDLILLDIMMPKMSGTKVLKELRKEHTALQLPVIMLTGKDDASDIVENLRNGANDYIIKPINIEVAQARINMQLRLKKLNADNLKKVKLETAHAMIATYNHEINNPLTIALGMLRKIERENDSEYVQHTVNALNRVVEIVRKIESVVCSGEIKSTDYTSNSKMIKI